MSTLLAPRLSSAGATSSPVPLLRVGGVGPEVGVLRRETSLSSLTRTPLHSTCPMGDDLCRVEKCLPCKKRNINLPLRNSCHVSTGSQSLRSGKGTRRRTPEVVGPFREYYRGTMNGTPLEDWVQPTVRTTVERTKITGRLDTRTFRIDFFPPTPSDQIQPDVVGRGGSYGPRSRFNTRVEVGVRHTGSVE